MSNDINSKVPTFKEDLNISKEECIRNKTALLDLLKTPGWDLLRKQFQEAYDLRIEQVIEPAETQDGLILKQFMTGSAYAFNLAQRFPFLLIEHYQSLIESENALSQEEEGENTNE